MLAPPLPVGVRPGNPVPVGIAVDHGRVGGQLVRVVAAAVGRGHVQEVGDQAGAVGALVVVVGGG